MEKVDYNVELKKIGESDCLVFDIDGEEHIINMNSEDQSNLEKLFFKIIEKCFDIQPVFTLSEESNNYSTRIFVEISQAYLKDLNDEIEKIMADKPSL